MVFFVVEYDTFPPTIKKTLQQGMQVYRTNRFFRNFQYGLLIISFNSIVNVILDLVAGGWSDWGPYSDCVPIVPPAGAKAGPEISANIRAAMPCIGSKFRKRICNNPPPQNGGPTCPGSAIEYEPCPLDCKGKPQLKIN